MTAMVSHASLAAEIDVVNSMSAEDRLVHARQRRQEQIQRWHDAQLDTDAKATKEKMPKEDVPNGKRFVKFGASVTLLEAAARDDVGEVKTLLENSTDPNESNDDGLTALHQACIDNLERMVRLLIKHGANVNAVDSEQWTPLHAACTCGHANIAMVLIQSGANLLALNADHNMPYDICEEDGTLDYVEKAMAGKGITQQQINENRSSKERQIITDMQELLDLGKPLDFKDEVGATVLHIAAANGYADLAKFLIQHNVKVNAQDDDGWTALHAAACWNQLDIVELLGQHAADPTIKNSLGEIPADVTDDEEIKILLVKIKSLMKDRKKKIFPGFRGISSRNNSRRASGIRGQSFKGRSKRDKKSGISTIEAKSEAQFWSGHQQSADIMNPKQPQTDNINHIEKSTAASNETVPENTFDEIEHKETKNGHENSSRQNYAPDADDRVEKNYSTPNHSKPDKKQKRSKKERENDQTENGNGAEKAEANGLRTGRICNVVASRNSYTLGTNDWSSAYVKEGGNASSGKTLAELKRERAQEKSNKASPPIPGGDHSPVITSFSDGMKQYKGQTADELSETSTSKRKSCIIL